MNPDDVVFVAFGARCPLVIREIEPSTYWLVGESYVHGLMDGEAVEEWNRGRLSREIVGLY
jgi:hypothetical protein